MTKSHNIMLRPQTFIGWFQKISIPIPRAASRNSEGEGGLRRLEFQGHGGLHRLEFRGHGGGGFIGLEFRRHTGGFQESNFQFGVVKSLQEKLVENDLHCI